ncbi:MAG: hypothetical protein JO121_08850 [Deltaproteobacteria bacterium]|nr:hypothetical protein [Deltaproteobacteria bacterium]
MVAPTSANGSREGSGLYTEQRWRALGSAFLFGARVSGVIPKGVVQILAAEHFALDTAADQSAQHIREFMK